MKALISAITIIALALVSNQYSFTALKSQITAIETENQMDEVLYLPNGKALSIISLGYKDVLADILWFNTLNYFGKHYRKDHKYLWLEHMCNLIVDLDPGDQAVYEFCGLVLSWEANNYQAALNILSKAINHNPNFWRYYYLKGMTYMLFAKDEKQSRFNFEQGAKTPGAPAFMSSVAARKMVSMDDAEEALSFLAEMIKNSPDDKQKEILIGQYQDTQHKVNIKKIEKEIESYRTINNKLPANLKELGFTNLDDPYGGKYFMNSDGSVESTSHKSTKSPFKEGQKNGK